MKIAVAVFAKTIGLSGVKTRLAADIGQEKAEAFYRLSVRCIEEMLQTCTKKNSNIHVHWALAEESAPSHEDWHSFTALWTGEGGLGQRLSNISNGLLKTHDAVILMGTDSPQLSAKRILQVVGALEVNPDLKHIASPATDGGFWLWASKQPLPDKVWNSVTYSRDDTLEQLIKATNEFGHSVLVGRSMQDVDVLEDLSTLHDTLEQKSGKLLPAQIVLLKWLDNNLPTFQE